MYSLPSKQNRRVILSTTAIRNNNSIRRKDIIAKSHTLFAYIEGDFKLLIDNAIFLEDYYMYVLELSVQLYYWLNNEGDFCYNSMSSEDKNILKFNRYSEMEYLVSSSWSELGSIIVSEIELRESVREYIEQINVLLYENYKINIFEFL